MEYVCVWFTDLPNPSSKYLEDTTGSCPFWILEDVHNLDLGFRACSKIVLHMIYAQSNEPGLEKIQLPPARWSSYKPSIGGQSSHAEVISNMLAFYEWIPKYDALLLALMDWLAQTKSDAYEDDPFDPTGTEWIPVRHQCLIQVQREITTALGLLSRHGQLIPDQGDIALSILGRIKRPCTCTH
jgi:hypothetical protein